MPYTCSSLLMLLNEIYIVYTSSRIYLKLRPHNSLHRDEFVIYCYFVIILSFIVSEHLHVLNDLSQELLLNEQIFLHQCFRVLGARKMSVLQCIQTLSQTSVKRTHVNRCRRHIQTILPLWTTTIQTFQLRACS